MHKVCNQSLTGLEHGIFFDAFTACWAVLRIRIRIRGIRIISLDPDPDPTKTIENIK